MKKMFIVMALSLAALVSCQKKETVEPEKPVCELLNVGYVNIFNKSDNPYGLYIDEVYIYTIPGGASREQVLKADNYTFNLVQESGYFITPTVYEIAMAVKQCDNFSWRP